MYKIQVYFPELNRWEWLHGLIGELKHSNKKSDAEVYNDDDTEFLEDKFENAKLGTMDCFRKEKVSETDIINHYVHLIENEHGSISKTPNDDYNLLKLHELLGVIKHKKPQPKIQKERNKHRRALPRSVGGVDFYDALTREEQLPLHVKKGDILIDLVKDYKSIHSVDKLAKKYDKSKFIVNKMLVKNKINQNHYHVIFRKDGRKHVFNKCSVSNIIKQLKDYGLITNADRIRNIINGHVKNKNLKIDLVEKYREVIVDD